MCGWMWTNEMVEGLLRLGRGRRDRAYEDSGWLRENANPTYWAKGTTEGC